jgi:hypothetical protein
MRRGEALGLQWREAARPLGPRNHAPHLRARAAGRGRRPRVPELRRNRARAGEWRWRSAMPEASFGSRRSISLPKRPPDRIRSRE